jgi:hypothetical protein
MHRTAYQSPAGVSSVMIGMLPGGMPSGSKPAQNSRLGRLEAPSDTHA